MNKLLAAMVVLCMTGCACARSKKEVLLRTALANTNVRLSEADDQNVALKAQVRRMATAWHNCKTGKGCGQVK